MTLNASSETISAAATMNERLPDQPTEPPFLLFEEGNDKYWGVADRDVPILIGAAAGAVGLVFLILGAVVIWYCCQVFFQQDKKSLYSPDMDSEDGSISSFDSYPFSESHSFGKKRASKMDSTRRSISAPMDRSIASRRGTEDQVFTSKIYNRSQPSYPAVIEVNEDMNQSKKGSRTDRSHLYHPTISSIVDSEELTMQQLAPQIVRHEKEGVLKVKEFSRKRKNRMMNDTAAAIARNLIGLTSVSRQSMKLPICSHCQEDIDLLVMNDVKVIYNERTSL